MTKAGPVRDRPFDSAFHFDPMERFAQRATPALNPAELLHSQAGVPDLGHVSDLVAVKLHHIDIVGLCAFARGRNRTAFAAMRAIEDAISADTVAPIIGCKRF